MADLSDARLVAAGPSMSVHVSNPDRAATLRDELNTRLVHARAYLRAELPEHLHARGNPRIGDIVVLPNGTGFVGFSSFVERLRVTFRQGQHGWDPRLPAMHGIFLAAGPGIETGVTLPPVEAVDVYPLVAHLLGLTPADGVAGSLAPFRTALQAAPEP